MVRGRLDPLAAMRPRWAPPEGRARVNWSHPLSAGLQGLAISRTVYLPARKVLVSTESTAITASLGAKYGLTGIGLRQATCGDLGAFPAQTDTTEFTMAAFNADNINVSTTSAYGIVGNRGLAGSSDSDHVKIIVSQPTASDNVFGYSVGGVRRGAGNASAFSAAPLGSLLVAVKRGLTCEIWQDGVLKQALIYTTGQLDATAKNCYYGCDEATVYSYPAFGAFWPSRALSYGEIQQVSVNPFAMLRSAA